MSEETSTLNPQALNSRECRAADFVARLYLGRMTDTDQQSLEDWLAESNQNRMEYQAALNTWNCLGFLAEDKPGELQSLLVKEEGGRTGKPKSWRLLWGGLALAATLLLTLSVVIPSWVTDKTDTSAPRLMRYATAIGEQKTIALPDGSEIILNTGSRLMAYFTDTERRTVLEAGEAFFDIARDPQRPFSVDTGSRAITVLGTQFNLYKKGLQLEIAVVEGEVVIHRPQDQVARTNGIDILAQDITNKQADQYRIPAGIAARFSGELGSVTSDIQVSLVDKGEGYPKWRNGSLRFNNEPLYDIVAELNRYTRKKILIQDRQVMDMKMSGVFKVDEIDAALSRFEKLFPLRVTHYEDSVVIEGR